MRQIPFLRTSGWMVLAALPLLLSGCDMALFDPKGQIGAQQKDLIILAFGVMQVIVIPVVFMTLFFAWRYRRSNIEKNKATYLPNWSHSTKIEAVVWAAPCIIILFLGVITWKTTHSLDPHKPLDSVDKAPLEVDVIALDWKWLFVYPEQGIATVNELYAPKDTPINFRVTSGSVMNSFYIPRLGTQIYAMSGMSNSLHLIGNEVGVYNGRSVAYSGEGFADMTFKTHITSDADFQAWVEKVKNSQGAALTFPEGYNTVAEPSIAHKVEYFPSVDQDFYNKVLGIFQEGHMAAMAQNGHESAAGHATSGAHHSDSTQQHAEAVE